MFQLCKLFIFDSKLYLLLVETSPEHFHTAVTIRKSLSTDTEIPSCPKTELVDYCSPDSVFVNSNYVKRAAAQNKPNSLLKYKSDVWLTVHRNSVWIRKTN